MTIGFEDPLPKFDAYITWQPWDPRAQAEEAEFIWNGQNVGRGKDGFMEILWRVAVMPRGSVVLAYPDAEFARLGAQMALSPTVEKSTPSVVQGWITLPIQNFLYPYGGLLGEVVVRRNLVIVYSPYDHKGQPHPAAKAAWNYRFVPDWAPWPKYNAYLTWSGYDGGGDPQEAIYLWQGKQVGKGSAGFQEVISRLEHLPPGSRVLVFPEYWEGAKPFIGYSDQVLKRFEDAVERQDLIILYSHRDQNGAMHPANLPLLGPSREIGGHVTN
jgi:hypothetical protein